MYNPSPSAVAAYQTLRDNGWGILLSTEDFFRMGRFNLTITIWVDNTSSVQAHGGEDVPHIFYADQLHDAVKYALSL